MPPFQRPSETFPAPHREMIACGQCDLLQYAVPLARHCDARCTRCGALLYRSARMPLDWMVALSAGSAVLFLAANLFPIASLEKQGERTFTTLAGTALALFDLGRPLVGALVLVTVIVFPALELCAMLYMLAPLRFGRIPPGMAAVFRIRLASGSWSMMEVFMLGLLVTLVKLADLATIVPGISLWAFAGLVILFSMMSASFSARDFWIWVDMARAGRSDGSDDRR